MAQRPTVAVIGAGFSGLLTALHLTADPNGPTVRLIERSRSFGRGAAYSTGNPDHLLNVRVANMSAYPDDPEHFTRWLATHEGWRSHGGFVTRGVYGDYLQDLLREALENTAAGRLLLEQDEAVDLQRAGEGWRVRLALGREIDAQAVVLALGVLRPAPPAVATEALLGSPRYIGDPWDLAARLPDDADDVLLTGSGLTMIDAAVTLWRPGRRFWAISRRGLIPRAHAPVAANVPELEAAGSPRQVLATVREASGDGQWREAIDALRPQVRGIWESWSQAQRRSFLRHLRPWWDVHRHRLAPSVARRVGLLMRSRELVVRAGEITSLTPSRDNVEVTWRPRGAKLTRRLSVAAVVNCAGLLGDLDRASEPLLQRLLARGHIRPDPCRLGAEVDPASRLIGTGGAPEPGLYAVGPLTRGAFWEITSVPDIRTQAAEAAQAILGRLRRAQAA
ncbi:MAG: FAD/NAD(P)-binding protein [Pseudomonadota bacterium]|uniref:FAD/NAD(P)-binding protein n=1 Tax=Phenylobacterium sp. TaxID=1871053 RepID=UPI0025F87902|nr:FAD/NAD(P)-binding protein [Phenylobacterium sp.]MBT9474110.1 FAD-dependent oxidoreductase [Phenylobacterium sp.]